jgi:hypothetical protein
LTNPPHTPIEALERSFRLRVRRHRESWLLPGGFERLAKRLPDTVTRQMKAGDVLPMLTPGGGALGGLPEL